MPKADLDQVTVNAASPYNGPLLYMSGIAQLDANGDCVIVFGGTFAVKPVVVCQEDNAADVQPLIFRCVTWATDGNGGITGVTIHAKRMRALPSSLILLTALQGFDIAAGSSANANFGWLATVPFAGMPAS